MACNIVGALLYLYCRSGCRADVVASALSFHPPEPFYDIEEEEGSEGSGQSARLLLNSELRYPPCENLTAHLLTTKNKTKVPVLCFRVEGAKLTVVFSHGNATDCGAMYILYFMIAHNCGVNVVGYDYTGYGASAKFKVRPTERQTYSDIDTVYDWLTKSKESGWRGSGTPLVTDPASQLIVYGQSLGSGPSCHIASRRPVAGLVLHSPIMSGIRVLTPSRALWCFDIFPNIDLIKKTRCRTLVIHGEEDSEVRVHHGQQLHDAVRPEYQTEPWWVPERGHNDLLQGNEKEYFARLRRYFELVESGPVVLPETEADVRGSSSSFPSSSSRKTGGTGKLKLVHAPTLDTATTEDTSATTNAAELSGDDADTTVLPDSPSSAQRSASRPLAVKLPASDEADEAAWSEVQSAVKSKSSRPLPTSSAEAEAGEAEAEAEAGEAGADDEGSSLAVRLIMPESAVGFAGRGVDESKLLTALDNKSGAV